MAHYNLGIVSQRAGEADQAIDHYQRAVALRLITRRRITTWGGFWLNTVSLPPQLSITKEPLRLIPLMQKHKTISVLRFLGSGVLMNAMRIIRMRSKSG